MACRELARMYYIVAYTFQLPRPLVSEPRGSRHTTILLRPTHSHDLVIYPESVELYCIVGRPLKALHVSSRHQNGSPQRGGTRQYIAGQVGLEQWMNVAHIHMVSGNSFGKSVSHRMKK